VSQANATNAFTVVVAGNGSLNLSATNNFTVVVNPLTSQPSVCVITSVAAPSFNFAITGPTEPDYSLQSSTNLFDWLLRLTSNSPATAVCLGKRWNLASLSPTPPKVRRYDAK